MSLTCDNCKLQPLYVPCPCGKMPRKVNLKKRLRRKFRAPRRIQILAQPKSTVSKFQPMPVRPFKREIEIVREPVISTRLRQLAIPKVRKLVAAKHEYAKFLPSRLANRFDSLIKKSLFTVYSRLANVRVPPRKKKPPKWTETEWAAQTEWLGRRAKAKWPFDFKLPEGFSDPITRVNLRALALEASRRPWMQRYQLELEKQTQAHRMRTLPDPFEVPLTKIKKSALQGPVSEYISQYGDWLKERAVQGKAEREQRMAEIHPEPRPQPQLRAKDLINKWPEKVVKLSSRPAWVGEIAANEAKARAEEMEAWERVSNRKKIKQKPPKRTLELALMTEEQKEEREDLLRQQKKEREELENAFKAKPGRPLPEGSRVLELAEPLERRKREKVLREREETRFVNYW